MATRSNPAKSAEQYGMAQAVLSGQSDAMPVKVARELVDRTSESKRREYARELTKGNPEYTGVQQRYYEVGRRYGLGQISKAEATAEIQEITGRPLDKLKRFEYVVVTDVFQRGVRDAKKGNPKKKDKGPISSTLSTIGGAGEFLDSQLGKVFNPRDGRFTGPQGKKAAEQYVRLLEAEGKKARVEKAWGDGYEVIVTNPRAKKNPEVTAADMYRSFHGKDSEAIEEFIEEEHYHGNLAELGQLMELKIITRSGLDAQLSFDTNKLSDQVLLCSNEDGTQMYLVGGDQCMDLEKLKMTGDWEKDIMVLGEVHFLSYMTEKDFDGFESIIYEHEVGLDEDARGKNKKEVPRPDLVYDTLNQKLSFAGGVYCIKKPLLETSRGIEK